MEYYRSFAKQKATITWCKSFKIWSPTSRAFGQVSPVFACICVRPLRPIAWANLTFYPRSKWVEMNKKLQANTQVVSEKQLCTCQISFERTQKRLSVCPTERVSQGEILIFFLQIALHLVCRAQFVCTYLWLGAMAALKGFYSIHTH